MVYFTVVPGAGVRLFTHLDTVSRGSASRTVTGASALSPAARAWAGIHIAPKGIVGNVGGVFHGDQAAGGHVQSPVDLIGLVYAATGDLAQVHDHAVGIAGQVHPVSRSVAQVLQVNGEDHRIAGIGPLHVAADVQAQVAVGDRQGARVLISPQVTGMEYTMPLVELALTDRAAVMVAICPAGTSTFQVMVRVAES